MPNLFDPLKIRDITLKNRIGVSPMCQYSAEDGMMNDWHFVHLGSRAVGGAALVVCEATAVQDIGRISPGDAGIWKDEQIEPMQKMNRFITANDSVPGIQLAHSGRKGSTGRPWENKAGLSSSEGGWQVIAPSAISFADNYPMPREMSEADIKKVIADFRAAAERAIEAEFRWVEIHAAHGYLLQSFLSPLSNKRTDSYGGSFENRIRFLLETIAAVKEIWPEKYPFAVRISASDWETGGWTIEDSVALAKRLKSLDIDIVDCSSGGNSPRAKIPLGPSYQVPFAEKIRAQADIKTIAVGMITEAWQANDIIESGAADVVFLARELLRNPYWPIHAAMELGSSVKIPKQYERAISFERK